MPSFAATVFPEHAKLDCSGFVYWAIRFPSKPPESRKVDHPIYIKVNGGWFETTGIYRDGKSQAGYFSEIAQPVVGACLVYPDYKDASGKSHDGHIGIVTQVDGKTNGLHSVQKIVHCSYGAWKSSGDAIQETPPTAWIKHGGAIAVWYEGFSDPFPG